MNFEQAFASAGKQKDSSGYYKMQDMSSEICNNVTVSSEESTTTLIDTRDGNTYTAAKLLDDKCWMTENLKLQNYKLSSDDSDVINDFVLPSSNTSWPNSEASSHAAYVYNYWYTWYAATAGTGTTSLSRGEEAPNSICPKGWRLPSVSGEGYEITKLYNFDTAQLQPANFKMIGYYINGRVNTGQTRFWTSTRSDHMPNGAAAAYQILYLNEMNLHTWQTGDCTFNYGYLVRCLSK